MSADEPSDAIPADQSPRKQRLKLIDIYTARGTFSGDTLSGIAARARELTLATAASPPMAVTEEQLSCGDMSGEASPDMSGDMSGDTQTIAGTGELTHIENTENVPNSKPLSSFTAPFTLAPHHPPHHPPPTSRHISPDISSYDTSHISPYVSPHTYLPIPLTEPQAILYVCLKHLNGALTSLARLSQVTGISEHTLKSCLKKLRHTGLIHHGGRQQFKGLTGFSAVVAEGNISLRGNEGRLTRKLQHIDYNALPLLSQLTPLGSQAAHASMVHPTDHPTSHPTYHPTAHSTGHPVAHGSKIPLQDLLCEEAFHDLDPRALSPYLEQFDTLWELQNFLDMANACIAAAKEGKDKPMPPPHAFLLAQLRAGYINPPEGFKSRRVRAQEICNTQLAAELATLRRLKEREYELRLALFEARLTPDERERLEQEAKTPVHTDANAVVSPAGLRQRHLDSIVREWFEKQT